MGSCSCYSEALMTMCCSALRSCLKWLKQTAKSSIKADEQENGSWWRKFTKSYFQTNHTRSHSLGDRSTKPMLWWTTSWDLCQPNLAWNPDHRSNKVNGKDHAMCTVQDACIVSRISSHLSDETRGFFQLFSALTHLSKSAKSHYAWNFMIWGLFL